MRIPIGTECRQVLDAIGVPDGYMMPAYIGVGYPADVAELEQFKYTADDKMHYGKW